MHPPAMKLSAHTPTEVLAKALWWIIHSESVSMLSWDAESLLSFSCRVATEKEDIDIWQPFVCTKYVRVLVHVIRPSGHEIELLGRAQLAALAAFKIVCAQYGRVELHSGS